MPPGVDAWEPSQYERFAAERTAPARDLMALVAPVPGGSVVDFGCGTGALTLDLHRHTGAATTTVIALSTAMLERPGPHAGDGVSVPEGYLRETDGLGSSGLVLANPSLQ